MCEAPKLLVGAVTPWATAVKEDESAAAFCDVLCLFGSDHYGAARAMSSRESAKRSSAEPPTAFLSPTEELLVKILNAPFMLVVPVLLSIIAYLSWIAYQNTHPPLFLLQNR